MRGTMDTNKVEKLALILLILFAVSIGISFFTKVFWWFFAPGFTESQVFTAFNLHTKLFSAIYSAFGILINIGCAIWLYITAKSNDVNRWLWTFLGLFAGIFAVILWFLWQIQIYLQRQDRPSEHQKHNPALSGNN